MISEKRLICVGCLVFVARDFNWSDGFMTLRLSFEYVTYWQIAKGDRESGPNLVGQRKRNFFAKIINFVVNIVFTATFLVEKRIDVHIFLHTTNYPPPHNLCYLHTTWLKMGQKNFTSFAPSTWQNNHLTNIYLSVKKNIS